MAAQAPVGQSKVAVPQRKNPVGESQFLLSNNGSTNYQVTACEKICMLAPSRVSDQAACTTPPGPETNCV